MSYFGFAFRNSCSVFLQLILNEMNEFTQWSTVNLIIIPVVHFCLFFPPLILFTIEYVYVQQESLNFFKAARQNCGL